MNTKIQRQLELEDEAVNIGIDKYEKAIIEAWDREQGSLTKPVQSLMQQCIEPMVLDLAKRKLSKNRGGNHEVKAFFNHFDNYELAFETCRVVFNVYNKSANITSLSIEVAESLIGHLNYNEFKASIHIWESPDGETREITGKSYVDSVVKTKKKQGTSDATILKALTAMFEDRGVHYTKFSKEFKVQAGMQLINILVDSTGLFRVLDGPRGQKFISVGTEVIQWIEDRNSVFSLMNAQMLPMIVPPKDWKGIWGGGYLSDHRAFKTRLVQARNKESINVVKKLGMSNVYATVNAIQKTPWKINNKILELAQTVWDVDKEWAGLPPREPKQVPAKPWGELDDTEWEIYKEQNPTIVSDWKEKARNIHNENASNISKRIAMRSKLWIANKFKDEEEIFFTCFLDWRGRIYFKQTDLTPQSDDLGKALIHFKNGVPLGERGAYWLAIHGANCAGVDKVSFEDRVKWVEDNEEMILKTAEDPISTLEWWADSGMDKPFGFVAFCYEWAGYKAEGNSFVSHLPIALDGSCNGIQHLSAMLKDPRGAKAVNLIPGDKPSDIYQEVADEVQLAVAMDTCEEAKALNGNITRSLVKRNVMTTPYGATKRGMIDQLIEDHKLPRKQATYLAEKNWDAIGQVVVASRGAMGWLQDVSKVLSDHNLPMIWETPSGFKVYHAYNKTEAKRIDTFWGGMRLSLQIHKEVPNTIAKTKQANGIAPNVVHSYDAAHLQNTAVGCLNEGVTDFAFIHDSYGTHAGNTDTLARVLREEFVKMYSGDALREFREQLREQVTPEVFAELPELPPLGDLDVTQVIDSPYFFA